MLFSLILHLPRAKKRPARPPDISDIGGAPTVVMGDFGGTCDWLLGGLRDLVMMNSDVARVNILGCNCALK